MKPASAFPSTMVSVFCVGLVILLLHGAASAADTNWREETGRFRIGFVSVKPMSAALADVEPFRLAIEEQLRLPVEALPMNDLSRLAGAHAEGRVEYAVYPATTYAAAWVKCECLEPVAVAMADDKTTAIHVVVIGRTAGGRLRARELPGKKIWLLTPDAAVLQQFGISGLKADGIEINRGDTVFLTADTPREAMDRFISGEGDALIGWSSLQGDIAAGYSRGTLKQLAERGGTAGRYTVVWQSPAIPHRVHAVRKNLDGEAKRILRETLAGMFEDDPIAYDSIEPVYGGGFQTIPQSAFSGAIKFVLSLVPGQIENEEKDDEPALNEAPDGNDTDG